MQPKILIVDDEQKIRTILTKVLSEEGYIVQAVDSGEQAIETMDGFSADLVIMDQNMPGMDGIETLITMKEQQPEVGVIILTAYGTISRAVDAIKKGAYDYLSKPFDNEELLIVVQRALDHMRTSRELSRLRAELREQYNLDQIIGTSPKMQRVFRQIKQVCQTDATVLIQGESGTGKELIARAIHYNSPRKDRPLVAVNCGAMPVNLLESELFGHEKGAFTDARHQQIGKFEQAQGGTLLLDEIGELPQDAQVKLLRVLEEKAVTRIGGHESIPVDIRIIAATNKDLQQEVQQRTFRLDLLYRLNVFAIRVPPLRERKEDIPYLIEHFLGKYNRELNKNIHSVSKGALSTLQDYEWPGNVRDLENAIESAAILTTDDEIQLSHLPMRLHSSYETEVNSYSQEAGLSGYMHQVNDRIEKAIILKALEKHNHNRTATADYLQISRKTLYNKMEQYGLL